MCGIAGLVHLDGKPVSVASIRRMMEIQRHRGPDDRGIRLFSLRSLQSVEWTPDLSSDNTGFEGAVGLNRLSILDLSPNGHQPMTNRDGSVFIAFNGEIYNAFDYRNELTAAGYTFRSRTDTEVILYLYERYGLEKMLPKLNGMFAICIVDLNNQKLFLIRDRTGVKPLYIYRSDDLFMFSSEIKSFLVHDQFVPELDQTKLDEHLVFRYCAGEATLFRNVSQLQPGCWLSLDLKGENCRRYWGIPDGGDRSDLTSQVAMENIEERLIDSVRLRLLSDVKVGCQLSGGVDSSLVAVMAARLGLSHMDAVSIIFDDPAFSEEKWMDRVVAIEPMKIHKYTVDPDRFCENFIQGTWHHDLPLNHPNATGIFEIARHAKEHVTILLSGEGADELFGGYFRYALAAYLPRVRYFMPLFQSLPLLGVKNAVGFSRLAKLSAEDLFIVSSAFMHPNHLLQIKPDFSFERCLATRRSIFADSYGDFVGRCLKYDLRTYLVDLLIRQDKMSMAHSIENRVPYLDFNLVAFVRSLPREYLVRPSIRIKERNSKILLKKLSEKYFGREFTYRPKSGFPMPLRDHFAGGPFSEFVEDAVLPGIRNRGILNADTVGRWWTGRSTAHGKIIEALWISIAFETWARQFLDGEFPKTIRATDV